MRAASLLIATLALTAAPAEAAQTPAKKPVAKAAAKAAARPAKAPAWTSTVVRTADGFRMGNPNAKVKLIEYGSRTCPVCGAFGREGTRPLMAYVASGKLSWEFREFLVHGQPDIAPALLGRCFGTAKFFPILERMYLDQDPVEEKLGAPEARELAAKMQTQPPLAVAQAWADYLDYIPFMTKLGIQPEKSRACLTNAKDLDAILRTMGEAQDKLNVNGTPSFFINGKSAERAYSWTSLEPLLQAAGV
jgi:protein-disulfide isomerase